MSATTKSKAVRTLRRRQHVASFVTGGGVMEATWAVLVAEFLQR